MSKWASLDLPTISALDRRIKPSYKILVGGVYVGKQSFPTNRMVWLSHSGEGGLTGKEV